MDTAKYSQPEKKVLFAFSTHSTISTSVFFIQLKSKRRTENRTGAHLLSYSLFVRAKINLLHENSVKLMGFQ